MHTRRLSQKGSLFFNKCIPGQCGRPEKQRFAGMLPGKAIITAEIRGICAPPGTLKTCLFFHQKP